MKSTLSHRPSILPIRPARIEDIEALSRLEKTCFQTDRLTRRHFRHFLKKGQGVLLVIPESNGDIAAYVQLLFSRATATARLYSIAVAPNHRGQHLGIRLVETAETLAREAGKTSLRLEIRSDNTASLRLFQKLGYREFDQVTDYYEDHMSARRFEKLLHLPIPKIHVEVPFYEQTLDFTCGPASLMMAMKALDPTQNFSRSLELRLWRESTTIFMTSGHGGCTPFGLGLAAWHRGFGVELYVNEKTESFIDTVRSPIKKEVIQLVQEDFLRELHEQSVPIYRKPLSLEALRHCLEQGFIALILISSWRIYEEKSPHWVVAMGIDANFVYVHDPFVDREEGETVIDSINMPILHQEFTRMSRYGRAGLKAAVVIQPPRLIHG